MTVKILRQRSLFQISFVKESRLLMNYLQPTMGHFTLIRHFEYHLIDLLAPTVDNDILDLLKEHDRPYNVRPVSFS